MHKPVHKLIIIIRIIITIITIIIIIHERMALQLQECLDGRGIPEWITKGRTVLLIKDKVKGAPVLYTILATW